MTEKEKEAIEVLEEVEEKRVLELEEEGLTHSDAVGVAMAEIIKKKQNNEKNN
jgi:hypothetical protein